MIFRIDFSSTIQMYIKKCISKIWKWFMWYLIFLNSKFYLWIDWFWCWIHLSNLVIGNIIKFYLEQAAKMYFNDLKLYFKNFRFFKKKFKKLKFFSLKASFYWFKRPFTWSTVFLLKVLSFAKAIMTLYGQFDPISKIGCYRVNRFIGAGNQRYF